MNCVEELRATAAALIRLQASARGELAVTRLKRTGGLAPAAEHVTQSILAFRGYKVLLDADLAALYGVANPLSWSLAHHAPAGKDSRSRIATGSHQNL